MVEHIYPNEEELFAQVNEGDQAAIYLFEAPKPTSTLLPRCGAQAERIKLR